MIKMKLQDRIVLFSKLGRDLREELETEVFEDLLSHAKSKNGWFTMDNLKKAIESIIEKYLNEVELSIFTKGYPDAYWETDEPKKVGIIAAGNIPLVGFQDLVHVVLSGHIAVYKPSTQDEVLIQYIQKKLTQIDPNIADYFQIADRLNNMDAYIATGSGNTSRYFEYYFAKKPHIIRKNRTSLAIIDGNESKTDLANIGNDIFSYFGLGCRNVAKLYVPENYDFTVFFESIEYWNTILMHSKYNNNYDYIKSIYLVNGVKHLDNGFLLLKNDESLASPIAALHYEYYQNQESLKDSIATHLADIQVIISNNKIFGNSLRPGESQTPGLADYADDIDTMEFLSKI